MSTCCSNTIKGFGQRGGRQTAKEEGQGGRRGAGPALRGLISWTRRSPVKRHVKKRVPLTFSLMNDPKHWERSRQCSQSSKGLTDCRHVTASAGQRGCSDSDAGAGGDCNNAILYIIFSKAVAKDFRRNIRNSQKNVLNFWLKHLFV